MRVIPKLERIQASVQIPGSREETLRSLLLAAVSPGTVTITNALDVDECRLVFETIRKLGWDVGGSFASQLTIGERLSIYATDVEIELFDSETAFRWLVPFLAFTPGRTMVRLSRDIDVSALVESLRAIDAEIEYPYAEGKPPLQIRGKLIRGGRNFDNVDEASKSAMEVVALTFRDGLRIGGEGVTTKPAAERIEVAPDPFLVGCWRALTGRIGGQLAINGRTEETPGWPPHIEPRSDVEREAARAIDGLASGDTVIENDGQLARAYPRFWRVLDEVVASSGRA